MYKQIILSLMMTATSVPFWAQTSAVHFDMSLTADGKITEAASGQSFAVTTQLPAVTADGPDGQALRFDGYSTYFKAAIPATTLSTTALTMSVVLVTVKK